MGSATRQALATARAALSEISGADLATAQSLFAAARVVSSSHQLRAAIADAEADPAAKAGLLDAVFGSALTPDARGLLGVVAAQRWSRSEDVLEGIEELGLRVAAATAPEGTELEAELFTFGRAVGSDAELELALSSKLGSNDAKVALVDRLLTDASPQARTIMSQLVQEPRGRRIGELIRHAAAVVADASGFAVATVTSAAPVAPAQLQRLAAGLSAKYGRHLRINQVIDPAILGGLRVQVGDDVTDGTIAKRLGDLRLQLAG